jgi:hypothetical protein
MTLGDGLLMIGFAIAGVCAILYGTRRPPTRGA